VQLLGYLLGKRVRNCQLIVLPVRRRAGQAIFDCSRECSGTPLVCPCPGTRASNQRTQTHTSTDSTHKQATAHRERENERKKERERERKREAPLAFVYDLHSSLTPVARPTRPQPTPPSRTGRRPAFLWDQDPTYTWSCPPLPPLGWPDWWHHSSELADALSSAVNPQAKSAQATSES
jgi:hypothetical protein